MLMSEDERTNEDMLSCPECRATTNLVFDAEFECRNCGYRAAAEQAADDAVTNTLDYSAYDRARDGAEAIFGCVSCDHRSMVVFGESGDQCANPAAFGCYCCGATWAEGALELCVEGEDHYFEIDRDEPAIICDTCFNAKVDAAE